MSDTCAPIRNELSALRARRREQAAVVEALPHNAGREHAEEVLDGIDRDIAAAEAELDLCEARAAQDADPVNQPVTGKVTTITCHAASKEVGPDEPYLLIAALDLSNAISPTSVGLPPPPIEVVKIGPWGGVNGGEVHYASHLDAADNPAFWDLDGDPRPIVEPDDVIFLVAMCENDASSPDAVRGAVRAELLVAQAANTVQDYDGYVSAMRSNMTGTIETARVAGLDPLHLNEDDLFGVKHLALAGGDLDRLNNFEAVEKSLRFTKRRKPDGRAVNDYTVTLSFSVRVPHTVEVTQSGRPNLLDDRLEGLVARDQNVQVTTHSTPR